MTAVSTRVHREILPHSPTAPNSSPLAHSPSPPVQLMLSSRRCTATTIAAAADIAAASTSGVARGAAEAAHSE